MPVIIAGRRKGAKLSVPAGVGVRPTLVRVREALFSMIYSEFGPLTGASVLDPFAGAGLLGLEAWSRGASRVDLMEMNRSHFSVLSRNVSQLRAGDEIRARLGQSPRDWSAFAGASYDIVLCDPPYADALMPSVLQALVAQNRLRKGALVSVELSAKGALEPPEAYAIVKERVYGQCKIVLLRYIAEGERREG